MEASDLAKTGVYLFSSCNSMKLRSDLLSMHLQICLGIQDLLDSPNIEDPAQTEAFTLFRKDKVAYEKKIREVAKQNAPKD